MSLFPVTGQPDFAETLEELVESYNSVRRNIEELVKLNRNLADEQQRHVRENMTEQGSVIFNILTRPAPELGADERRAVKKVARRLLERIQTLRVLDWRKRQSSHARVEDVIKDVLDPDLPRACGKPLYAQKCSALFEHICESYPERDAGVYALAS